MLTKKLYILKLDKSLKTTPQQFRVDFDQIFTAVIKSMAFRILFAIIIFFNFDIN